MADRTFHGRSHSCGVLASGSIIAANSNCLLSARRRFAGGCLPLKLLGCSTPVRLLPGSKALDTKAAFPTITFLAVAKLKGTALAVKILPESGSVTVALTVPDFGYLSVCQ